MLFILEDQTTLLQPFQALRTHHTATCKKEQEKKDRNDSNMCELPRIKPLN